MAWMGLLGYGLIKFAFGDPPRPVSQDGRLLPRVTLWLARRLVPVVSPSLWMVMPVLPP